MSAQAQADAPASLYYHRDHLGSVTVVTDASGAAVAAPVSYRVWGETDGAASPPSEFGYHGMRRAAGLYDYGARWYDPAIARFVQPDPVIADPYDPQGLGRYAYVRNDPVGRIDPTGAFSFRFNAWAGQIDPYGFTGISVGFDYGGGSWSVRGSASVRGVQVASAQIVQLAQAINEISRIGAFQLFSAIGVGALRPPLDSPPGDAEQLLTGPGSSPYLGNDVLAREEKVARGSPPFRRERWRESICADRMFALDVVDHRGDRTLEGAGGGTTRSGARNSRWRRSSRRARRAAASTTSGSPTTSACSGPGGRYVRGMGQ